MSMNIDKSLDEIITTNKKSRGNNNKNNARGGNNGGVGPRRGAAQQTQTTRRGGNIQSVKIPTGPAGQSSHLFGIPGLESVVGDKIVISNLPDDVTEVQIKELFASTVGPLKSASLSYDSKGKSKGVATVQFNKAADATKAYQQYNKRLIDGKRPMKVEIIVDPTRVPAAPLHSRLGAAPMIKASNTVAAAGGSARQARTPVAAGATRGGKAGGRGGRGGKKGGNDRPKATVESLDAEMSDYQSAVIAPAV